MQYTLIDYKDWSLRFKFGGARFFFGILMAGLCYALCKAGNGSITAKVVLCGAILFLSTLQIQVKETVSKCLHIAWAMIACFAVLYTTQMIMGTPVSYIELNRILLGVACYAFVFNVFLLITQNIRVSIISGSALMTLLTIANYFVLNFRGSELNPMDLLSIGTAANVAGQYAYEITPVFAYGCSLISIYCFSIFCIPIFRAPKSLKKAVSAIVAACVLFFGIVWGMKFISVHHYREEGTSVNGFIVHFIRKIEDTKIEQPQDYSNQAVQDLEREYANEHGGVDRNTDVVIIMCEAFVDLRVIGELKTDTEVMPFLDSLQENVIRGFVLSSVFGGGTCNSEYELLTGNTMAFMPSGSSPYQQYIKNNIWSAVSNLEMKEYTTLATHPQLETNWMRSTVYPYLGFDESKFIDDYSQKKKIRGHVSDQEMYEHVIQWYEQMDEENPRFLFGITMQNHSPFNDNDFPAQVHLQGYSKEYSDVEQYLTLIRESDIALEYLINYFKTVERDVVVLFFGDHLPRLDPDFYEELGLEKNGNLENQMKQYMVPFVVWANYDIEEEIVPCTSLNYLLNYVYTAAGIERSPYNEFLKDIENVIPAMNPLGYYSKEKGCFVEYGEESAIEKEWLEKYHILQYNSVL